MATPVPSALGHSDATYAPVTARRDALVAGEWPVFAVLAASAAIIVGLVWDISWHRTIGRDTFWSPPHVIQQAGAIIAGLSCGYLALRTSFAGDADARARSVRFWRWFRAPLGAWVCIWGTIMMLTSAPFDDWWHNAYGLDVKIISPPHVVLASGMIAIQLGAMLMALGAQNRAADEASRKRLGTVFTVSAAVIILMAATMTMEEASFANTMRGSSFYRFTAVLLPLFLVAFARASRLSWPATRIALLYMAMGILATWILQLVPARPMLAPIYNPVTHMVPPPFPMLLIVPAIGIDLLLRRFGDGRDWLLAAMIGVVYVGLMLAAHWYWSEFLLSPNARNFVFGSDKWDYTTRLGPWRYEYWNLDVDTSGRWSPFLFAQGMAIAVVTAMVTSRIGLAWGKAMSRVRR